MHNGACIGLVLTIVSLAPAAAEVRTRLIDYEQGGTALQGYLAWDDALTGKRPGVLLIHRRDGMSDLTLTNTREIAKLGYVVFAADIFGKSIRPKDDKESGEQSAIYNKDRPLMRARAQAGLSVLQKLESVDASKIAMIGYCFGGTTAVELVETGAPILGMVSVHGSFRGFERGAAKNIKGSVLILHGADDTTAPLSEVELLIGDLRETKIPWSMELYGGANHGFTTPKGAANERANEKAWIATKAYLSETLGR